MCISRILNFLILSRLKKLSIEGIGPDMTHARTRSLAALEEAAADIGDTLKLHPHRAVVDAGFANSLYVNDMIEVRSFAIVFGKILVCLVFAALLALLFSFHTAARPLQGFLCFLVYVNVTAAFVSALIIAARLGDAMNSKARIRTSLLMNASRIWSIGDKAVYSTTHEEVQVIRIDAIGSVSLKGDGILIRSRFGEPTASLPGGGMEDHVLKELVADLKSRIA